MQDLAYVLGTILFVVIGALFIETPDFSIDLSAKRIRRAGKDVRLTATEWRLVEMLAWSPGRLISQQELIENPKYFVTEPGSGMRYVPEGVESADEL